MMKILILTAKFGMGHLSASNAIKEDILKFDKNADVKVVDFYEYSMPFLSKYIYKGFNLLIKFGKELYKLYYSENDKKSANIDLLTRKLAASCKDIVDEERPDVIVSTFPMISKGVGYFKKINNSNISLVTCITDISSHYEWITENTDKYLVPCTEVRDELIDKGIDADKLLVYGIPVAEKFKKNFDKLSRQRFVSSYNKVVEMSVYRNKKELLIMGGGLGVLPKNEDFYKKLDAETNLHTTIVAGKNEDLYNMINGKYDNITVLGYTDKVDKLMEKADCVVTKPGGITMFEAIYSLTPIISFSTDLPNELHNIDFIKGNNFGIALTESAEESVDTIVDFVNNFSTINNMKNSMKRFVYSLENGYFADYISRENLSSRDEMKVKHI